MQDYCQMNEAASTAQTARLRNAVTGAVRGGVDWVAASPRLCRIGCALLGKHCAVRHNAAMQVSVAITVYNESANVARLMASLAGQQRRPDEVVICDGGSTDDTTARLQQLSTQYAAELPMVRVIVEPGANISRGRNVAIAAAAGPIIAVTDAGVRLDSAWLANLAAPWEARLPDGEAPIAVAGFFAPDVEGVFQTAMAATVLPLADEIDPQRFLPSSRSVAFTKTTWKAAGGYPEWLDYCEDLLFDFEVNALRPAATTAFVWSPNALVYFRPASLSRPSGHSTIAMHVVTVRRTFGANVMLYAMPSIC